MEEAKEQQADNKPAKKAPKPFVRVLEEHHFGYTAQEATDKLAEAVAASERTGKATEVIIRMKIKPVSKAQGRYDVLIDVDNKLPPKEREAAIMFVGPDMNLSVTDPRQQTLPGIRLATESGPGVRADAEERQPAIKVG